MDEECQGRRKAKREFLRCAFPVFRKDCGDLEAFQVAGKEEDIICQSVNQEARNAMRRLWCLALPRLTSLTG